MQQPFRLRPSYLALLACLAIATALPAPVRAEGGASGGSGAGSVLPPSELPDLRFDRPIDGPAPLHRPRHPPHPRVKVPLALQPARQPRLVRRPVPTAVATLPTLERREVLVETAPALPDADLLAIGQRNGLTLAQTASLDLLGSRMHRFLINDGRDPQAVATALRREPQVLSAQPNFLYRPAAEDPAAVPLPQYALALMDLDPARSGDDGAGSRIGVLDTGIAADQPEIGAAVADRYDPVGDVAADDLSHGTALAGIIAAHARLKGVAPAASLLSVRAFRREDDKTVAGTSFLLLQGVDWLAGRHVRVVNMSFAGPADPLFLREVKAATAGGMIAIAAAGNGGETAEAAYPAADPEVLAVTAVDDRRRLYPAANRGAYVAVAAPGVDILVATPDKAYATISGTSLATAHVSGLVALLLQKNPALTGEDVRRILSTTAVDLGAPGRDPLFGAGLVDAARALQAAAAPLPAPLAAKAAAP